MKEKARCQKCGKKAKKGKDLCRKHEKERLRELRLTGKMF